MVTLAPAGQVLLRVGAELGDTAFAAEVIDRPLVIDLPSGARRVDGHSADRIQSAVRHESDYGSRTNGSRGSSGARGSKGSGSRGSRGFERFQGSEGSEA